MSAIIKWLKWVLLLFVIAVAAIGAAFYVLYFRRTPLPPAAPHALVAPSVASLPGLSACWIETGKTFSNFSFGSTAGGILVRHPAGDLLIDTGNSSHFDDEIRGYPFRTWLKLRFLAGRLKPPVPLPELLRLVKEDPRKLRWVILSHAHLDHSGGLMDLPNLPILLLPEELRFAADPNVEAKGYVMAEHAQRFPAPGAPTLRFDRQPYETFDESADLYKDGSVVVVPLRGHTPGSVGIFVNLSPSRRLFYVGDAVDDERGFKERVGKSLILRDSDNDEVLANQIVVRLSDLHEKLPELAIIPAHGRSAYKTFFRGGPLSCVSAQ
jgi:N-acyl homoserine lactone hydrolase